MSTEENSFARVIKEKGLGFLYGLERGQSESEEEFQQRIALFKQQQSGEKE